MTVDTLIPTIAKELNVGPWQVQAAVDLLDADNTIPFIARYRKEATGTLDEEQLRTLEQRLHYLRALAERQQTVLASIEEQGKLTDELRAAIETATTLQQLEDLYRPYKPKRRTRAAMAREKGLAGLADLLLTQPPGVDRAAAAQPYLNEQVPDVEAAYAGARDIVAEVVTDDPEVRQVARGLARRDTAVQAGLVEGAGGTPGGAQDERGVYRQYYDFKQSLSALQPHQILALNRGEREEVLRLRLTLPGERILTILLRRFSPQPASPLAADLQAAVEDGYERLLAPAVERDLRRELSEAAEAHAIRVFATNLRGLLLQRPLRGHTVIALDPGFRTGCKVAVVDPTGKVLNTGTIYPHEPQRQWDAARAALLTLIQRYRAGVIAIGNGTASRETEQLAAETIARAPAGTALQYVMVSEAGASVYSASPLARQELPELDVALRGAVSIGRRLQDPLAELVKIDPKSIGVGLYQHDVDQKALGEALDGVVESVVNTVGVNANTASPALLRHVAGLGPKTAGAIVTYRDAHGPFRSRAELQRVPGVGAKTFQQAAGFLRVPGGDEPLDNTAIHPESYPAVRVLFDLLGVRGDEPDLPQRIAEFRAGQALDELAALLEIGEPTLVDILDALARPGRDPRDDLPPVVLRSDVLKVEDLQPGMELRGTVRNVVDFGAFVDIGVKQDGLVHVSQMANRYVQNPYAVVAVGDVVDVTVLSVDAERGRIALSMRTHNAHGRDDS